MYDLSPVCELETLQVEVADFEATSENIYCGCKDYSKMTYNMTLFLINYPPIHGKCIFHGINFG